MTTRAVRPARPRSLLRSRYDVAIVGGGHNGLAAAAYLARAGRSCVVFERRDVLGGGAVSERVFAGVDARLSRYAYLVSLLPELVVRELGLPLGLARRRVASYTPDPRVAARRGLLVPCECYCHSLTDPTILGPALRAAGAQTLTVFALQMPARLFACDPHGARDAAVQATLRSLDSVLAEPIAGCLATGPGGEPCLEACTPLDIEHELAMPRGHIFHSDLSWPYAERPDDVGSWGAETAHPRILLCGASARRGGGVSAVPGRNAAMALLRRRRDA